MTRTSAATGVSLRAAAVTVASVLPVFLAGGVAVQMRHDLGFGPAGLGLGIAGYYASSALAAVPAGRAVRRHGAARTSRFAVTLAAAAMLAVAVAAHGLVALCLLLALAAVANSVGQVSSNQLLARAVPVDRQGLGFAVKQAALPAATLLAGAAVPAVAVTVGWRWAFALAAALAAGCRWLVPRDRPSRVAVAAVSGRPRRDGTLVLLALGGGLSAAAANCLGTFLVDSIVARGGSAGRAGVVLTLGSVLCVGARLAGGAWVDRRAGRPLRMVVVLLGFGAAGVTMLAAGWLGAGVALAFGCGWSWPGLLNYAVVRRRPDAPAEATGVLQTGVYIGGCVGPLLFGALAARAGYPAAWAADALVMVAAGMVLLAASATEPVERAVLD